MRQYVSEELINQVLSMLEESRQLDPARVCYVLGTGNHPRSSYADLHGQPGIRVVYYESVLPRGLRFIPSYRGFVKIDEPLALGDVFRKLIDRSTAIVLIFDAVLEPAFVESIRGLGKQTDYSFGIEADPGYLIYLVDADRDDSPTGMVHFLSYGKIGPWKTMFEDM